MTRAKAWGFTVLESVLVAKGSSPGYHTPPNHGSEVKGHV